MFYNGFWSIGNSDRVVIAVSFDFFSNSKGDASFYYIAYDYSCVDWDVLGNHLRDVSLEDIFVANEFCKWVQIGTDVYNPHGKYQVKPHSFRWFSAACVAAIVQRNHYFCIYQRVNLLNLK